MEQIISVIIPTLNEAAVLKTTLSHLKSISDPGVELIVVDGGSSDETPLIAGEYGKVLSSARGRALQMNLGAQMASGEILLFLHCDSLPEKGVFSAIRREMADPSCPGGCLSLQFADSHPAFRLIEWGSNWRARWLGWMYGDQAIFVNRKSFTQLKGFPEIELMEDLAFSRALKQLGRPVLLPLKIITSSRRFRKFGIWKTLSLMQYIKLRYLLGKSPAELAKLYPNQN